MNESEDVKRVLQLIKAVYTTDVERGDEYDLTSSEIDYLAHRLNVIQDKLQEARDERKRKDEDFDQEQKRQLDEIQNLRIDEEEEDSDVTFQDPQNATYSFAHVNDSPSSMIGATTADERSQSKATNYGELTRDSEVLINRHSAEIDQNTSRVDLANFINEENQYLKMERISLPCEKDIEEEQIQYPLGVVFDEKRKVWMFSECNTHKIIVIRVGDEDNDDATVFEHDLIQNPTAIIVFKNGHSVAVLCSKSKTRDYWIATFKLQERTVIPYASYTDSKMHLNQQCRGLAKTIGGHLMTVETSGYHTPVLRIFKQNESYVNYPIMNAKKPCFIASNRDRVAITDLNTPGDPTQRVFLLKVDDSDWTSISNNPNNCIQVLKILGGKPVIHRSPAAVADSEDFLFVAGVQFDCNGNMLIGDAKGHSLKLFDPDLNMLHRVSSDFGIPFMSSFFVNSHGQIVMIDLHGKKKFMAAQLTCVDKVLPHIEVKNNYTSSRGRGNMRGGFRGSFGRGFAK